MSAAAKPVQRSAPPAAAPVNRGNGTRPGVVKLSGVEAETAKMLGMTEKEYALNKLALQREGKLPN
jgi:phage I-like protein